MSFIFILKDLLNGNYNELIKKENMKKKKKENELNLSLDNKNKEIIKNKNIFSQLIENIINIFTGENFLSNIIWILSIIFIYFIRSYFSIVIIIYLAISFLFLDILIIRFLSIVILLPITLVILICITLSRIFYSYFNEMDNIKKIKYLHFCLGNYNYDLIIFYALNLYFIILICFLYFIKGIQEKKNSDKKARLDSYAIDSNGITNKKRFTNFEQDLLINVDNNSEDKLSLLEDKIKVKGLNKELEEVNIINIIKKFIFIHLNKITLLIMYFVVNKDINLVHFIILIIFMIQLIKPILIKDICIPILILLQSLFLLEYLMDLIKVYHIERLENNLVKINFFFKYEVNSKDTGTLFDTNIEILLYLVIYFFYFHYLLFNNESLMTLSKNNNITISNYIKIKIKNKKCQNALYMIGNIIKDIYTWGIIVLYVFFSCYFEINIIFAINLVLFFICVYKFCVFIQINRLDKVVKKSKEVTINLIFAIIVLFIAGLHTIFSYLYQLLCSDFIGLKEKVLKSNNWFVKNLPTMGFTIYSKDNLYLNLLPHFLLSFLSLLFLRIVVGILKESKEKEKEKHKESIIDEDNKSIKSNKSEQKEINNEINIENNNEIEIDELNEEKKEKKEMNAEEYRNKAFNEYNKNKKEISSLNIKYFFSMIIITITKLYWLVLFFTTGIS